MSGTHLFIMLHPDLNSLGRPTMLFESSAGGTHFSHMVRRLGRCDGIDSISILLPEHTALPESVTTADLEGIPLLVGPGFGVLERLVARGIASGAETVLRINGDAAWPLPDAIDDLLAAHVREGADITLGEFFPGCLGIDILSAHALQEALNLGPTLSSLHRTIELYNRRREQLRLHPACSGRNPQAAAAGRFLLVDDHSRDLFRRLLRCESHGQADTPEEIGRERLAQERGRALALTRPRRRREGAPGILFVNNVARIGGAENSMTLLVRELSRRGSVRPVIALFEDGELAQRFHNLDLPVEILANPHTHDNMTLMSGELDRNFTRILRRHRIRLVHANSITANAQIIRSVLAAGMPSVSHVRDPVANMERMIQFSLHLTRVLVAVSGFIADSLNRASGGIMRLEEDLFAVHNGIDFSVFDAELQFDAGVRRELQLGENNLLIGSLSQVNAWKGQDVLIRAAEPILRNNPAVHLAIVGSATVNPAQMAFVHSLHTLVSDRGLGAQVHFLGQREHAPAILREFDIFAHVPTGDDPFPRVVIEAMAAGRAIVGSRSGGITEALEGGKCGELVPMKDEEATRQALERLIENEKLRREMGKKAGRRARREFTIAQHVDRIESVYAHILGR
jgi:glycosyltransferase involved in cell wall biosynthesis